MADKTMTMQLSIKNWKKFQHYKGRRPPWIKLYRELLDDPEWFALSGDEAKFLVMLWLLASEQDGKIPAIDTLAFRLRMTSEGCNSLLDKLKHWVASKPLADCKQRATPETETERDSDTETEKEKNPQTPKGERVSTRFIPPTVEEVKAYCDERHNGIDPETFVAHYERVGWVDNAGNKIKSWKACVVTWEKRDAKSNQGALPFGRI